MEAGGAVVIDELAVNQVVGVLREDGVEPGDRGGFDGRGFGLRRGGKTPRRALGGAAVVRLVEQYLDLLRQVIAQRLTCGSRALRLGRAVARDLRQERV